MMCYFKLDYTIISSFFLLEKMKPSRTELNSQTGNSITQKNKIKCPDGTIPVLRNTKDFLTSANLFPENYVHPHSVDSPGTHVSIHFRYNLWSNIVCMNVLILYIYIFVITGFFVDCWSKVACWSISWYTSLGLWSWPKNRKGSSLI